MRQSSVPSPHRPARLRRRAVLAVFGLLVSVAITGCHGSRLEADQIPVEDKMAFTIKKGMSRDRVEAVLGYPTSVGQTKTGDPFAVYEYEGMRIRSIEYDANDRVVVAYP